MRSLLSGSGIRALLPGSTFLDRIYRMNRIELLVLYIL